MEIDNAHWNFRNFTIVSSICCVVVVVVVVVVVGILVHEVVSFFDVKWIRTCNGADKKDQERPCQEALESIEALEIVTSNRRGKC